MLGTFGGALDARRIDASNGKLVAEVTGDVEEEEGRYSSGSGKSSGRGVSFALINLARVTYPFLVILATLQIGRSRVDRGIPG